MKELREKAYRNLKDKTLQLKLNDERIITIAFPRKSVDHLVNEIMLKLSGGNFTEHNIIHIDEILRRSKYVPTSGELTKERSDDIKGFFRYRDRTGKEVDFKIAYDPKSGNGIPYYPWAVNDKGK